ncbi:MAG: hypothetical protein ABIG11_06570 [bacterium]
MKKCALMIAVALALGAGSYARAEKAGHDCPKAKKEAVSGHKCKGDCKCLTDIKGTEVKVENTADGVTVQITGKDAETVKKIQEVAAVHFTKGAAASVKSDAKAELKESKCGCQKGD